MAELIPKYLDPDTVRVVNGDIPETTKVSKSIPVSCIACSRRRQATRAALGSQYALPCTRPGSRHGADMTI